MAKKMAVCPVCNKPTEIKGFSILFFLLTCWFGLGFIYLIIYLLRGKKCKNCGCKF